MKDFVQQRRAFIKSLGVLSAAALAGSCGIKTGRAGMPVNKREAIFNLIEGAKQEYVPGGFFVHFGDGYRWGDAAVDRHLEYFQAINMDFIKIQYEAEFPLLKTIRRPEDWANMPFYKKDFFEKQLYVVGELVKKGKKQAPVIATLYSPFMSAGHSATGEVLTEHMKQDPERVRKGLEIITESTLIFARECIRLGVDGFLSATQGGEAFRFQDPAIFRNYVKPYDLVVMKEINDKCPCNVLHICDYVGDYDDLSPFTDYPGHIVNCSMKVAGKKTSPKDIYEQFKRPVFGGLEKRGAISQGDPVTLRAEVEAVLKNAPERFILGAECALQGQIDWKQVRMAVEMAHGNQRMG